MTSHLRVAHDDVELWTLPMFHCNGWGGVYALTGMGGTHVVLRAIDGVRTKPRFVVAGAPPPAAFIERLEKELGWDFIEIYGLTETAPILTVSMPDFQTKPDDWPRRS